LEEEFLAERCEPLGFLAAAGALDEFAAACLFEFGELVDQDGDAGLQFFGTLVEGTGFGVDLESFDAFAAALAEDCVGERVGPVGRRGEAGGVACAASGSGGEVLLLRDAGQVGGAHAKLGGDVREGASPVEVLPSQPRLVDFDPRRPP